MAASPPVSSPYCSLSTCPTAHGLLGEDLERAVLWAGGSAPLFYSGLGLRVERDVKQNKIQPCGSDGHVTSASGGPELVQLLPILPKHKSCKNHSYRAWYCVGLVTKSCPALATSRTVACQVLSMGFSRQEYWSELPFPSPGVFPTQESAELDIFLFLS